MANNRTILHVAGFSIFISMSLTGCASAGENTSTATSTTPTQTASVTESPLNTETPSTASPAPLEGISVGFDCEKVMSTKALYDYNPNFAFIADRPAPSGSTAEKLKGLNGITCSYENLSGGTTVDIAVAKLIPQSRKTLVDELSRTATSVSNYGSSDSVHGYFDSANGVGIAQAISGDYWIVAESAWFTSPSEATNFISAALNATR